VAEDARTGFEAAAASKENATPDADEVGAGAFNVAVVAEGPGTDAEPAEDTPARW
jgi:hypothetical protein